MMNIRSGFSPVSMGLNLSNKTFGSQRKEPERNPLSSHYFAPNAEPPEKSSDTTKTPTFSEAIKKQIKNSQS